MTEFRPVTDDFFAAPQIQRDDFAKAAEMGIRVVINNRPDGEEEGQLANDDAARYARDAGLAYLYIPIVSGQPTVQAVKATVNALKDAEGPVLGYCRTGTRSTILWGLAMAAADGLQTETIIDQAGRAGYDLSPLAEAMENLRAAAD